MDTYKILCLTLCPLNIGGQISNRSAIWKWRA